MDNIRCFNCNQSFSSRYNLLRHKRNKHNDVQSNLTVPLGALEVYQGAPQGAPGAPYGAQGAPYGAQGVPPGAPRALGAPQGAPGAPQGAPGAQGAPQGAPRALGAPLGALGSPQGAALEGSREKNMILHHPFTMMISGPTACGKTTFVKSLLQHHATRIQPRVQRIVYMYNRWQPIYTILQKTVYPRVQFIQGIPADLDDDDFFDPTINNLLVIDDLFSEAGKDKRITGLYTEGSHHRSLSVIGINQNVFGTKDLTQRRNCHYLVIYKNPVDTQAVMSLARQMYPGRSEIFMNTFAKATKQPYSPMLVDLKVFTPEHERLKSRIVWQDETDQQLTNQKPDASHTSTKEDTQRTTDHSSVGVRTVNIETELLNTDNMADTSHSCDDCGLVFDTSHDVQRHVKSGWCPEYGDVSKMGKPEYSEEPVMKKRKFEDMEEDIEDNEAYLHLWKKAKEGGENKYTKLRDRYVEDGEDEETAEEMATEDMQPYNERDFIKRYEFLIDQYILPLENNANHTAIMNQIALLRQKGVNNTSAIKRVLKKNANRFEDLYEVEFSDEESDEDDDDGDEDEESSE